MADCANGEDERNCSVLISATLLSSTSDKVLVIAPCTVVFIVVLVVIGVIFVRGRTRSYRCESDGLELIDRLPFSAEEPESDIKFCEIEESE